MCTGVLGNITMKKAKWNSSWAISNPKRWCCESDALNMQANWKTQQWPQNWKRSVFILTPKKGNAKECSNYHTIVFISHAMKVMLQIFQHRLQQYVNWEPPDVQAGFRKEGGTRDQIANIRWIQKKQGNSRKISTSASWMTLKPLTLWITTKSRKFFERWENQTTVPASLLHLTANVSLCQSCWESTGLLDWPRSGHLEISPSPGTTRRSRGKLEPDMEQQTGSKLG